MSRAAVLFSALAFGYAFLYVPILLLIVYSFNDSANVAIWGSWTVRWYRATLEA